MKMPKTNKIGPFNTFGFHRDLWLAAFMAILTQFAKKILHAPAWESYILASPRGIVSLDVTNGGHREQPEDN